MVVNESFNLGFLFIEPDEFVANRICDLIRPNLILFLLHLSVFFF